MTDWKQEIKHKTFQAFERQFGFRPTRGQEDQFLLDKALNLAEEHYRINSIDCLERNEIWKQKAREMREEITRLKAQLKT